MYKKAHSIIATYYFSALIVLFLVDLFCFSFFEQRIFYLVLSLYCIESLRPKSSTPRLVSTLLLIALDSFLQFGRFGITLLYLIPLTFIARKANNALQTTNVVIYCFFIFCLLAQFIWLEPFVLGMKSSASYITAKIIINIIVFAIIRRL